MAMKELLLQFAQEAIAEFEAGHCQEI
jgi:hypothetical protein